jgi:hypothetical protein
LRAELALDLMLCGVASPDKVDRSLLVPVDCGASPKSALA